MYSISDTPVTSFEQILRNAAKYKSYQGEKQMEERVFDCTEQIDTTTATVK